MKDWGWDLGGKAFAAYAQAKIAGILHAMVSK